MKLTICYCTLDPCYKKVSYLIESVSSTPLKKKPQHCELLGIQAVKFTDKKLKWWKGLKQTNSTKKPQMPAKTFKTPTLLQNFNISLHLSTQKLPLLTQVDCQPWCFKCWKLLHNLVQDTEAWNSCTEKQATPSSFLPPILLFETIQVLMK